MVFALLRMPLTTVSLFCFILDYLRFCKISYLILYAQKCEHVQVVWFPELALSKLQLTLFLLRNARLPTASRVVSGLECRPLRTLFLSSPKFSLRTLALILKYAQILPSRNYIQILRKYGTLRTPIFKIT